LRRQGFPCFDVNRDLIIQLREACRVESRAGVERLTRSLEECHRDMEVFPELLKNHHQSADIKTKMFRLFTTSNLSYNSLKFFGFVLACVLLQPALSFSTSHSTNRRSQSMDTLLLPYQRRFVSTTIYQPSSTFRHSRPNKFSPSAVFGNIELKDLFYDDTSAAFNAWEWTANMGAPAALIGGAVLVTLSETREALAPRKSDSKWVRVLKQSMRFLLLSSFALEVVSIFVGTMTGSVLLGHGSQVPSKIFGYQSPLQLLYHHHE